MEHNRFKKILDQLETNTISTLTLANCEYLSSSEIKERREFDEIENEIFQEEHIKAQKRPEDPYNDVLTARQVKALHHALEKNTSLRKLNLSSNFIGSQGVWLIASALNESITELNLSATEMTYHHGRYHHLKVNDTDEQSAILGKHIRESGLEKLAHVLREEHGMEILRLGQNQLNDQDIEPLLKALKKNKNLTLLDLACNPITDQGADSIMDLLIANKHIEYIQLEGTKISQKKLDDIHSMLVANREEKKLKELLTPEKENLLKSGGVRFTLQAPPPSPQPPHKQMNEPAPSVRNILGKTQ